MLTEAGFKLIFTFAATVPPLKLVTESEEKVEAKIFDESEPGLKYLLKIFDEVTSNCKINVLFASNDNQQNGLRSNILSLLNSNRSDTQFKIAFDLSEKLAKATDDRNKHGLFIILIGKKLSSYRVVLIRFRAEEVVYKKVIKGGFKIDLLKEAFTKNSKHYKVAYFEDELAEKGSFWTGYILDRQRTGDAKNEVSDYWIKDFLECEYAMTNLQGTRKLADYIKSYIKTLDSIDATNVVIDSVINLRNNLGNEMSILSYAEDFLPPNLRTDFRNFVGDDDVNNTLFNIDIDTYDFELPFKTITTDNKITLTVPTFMGSSLLTEKILEDGRKEFTFSGRVTNLKFTKKG